MFQANESVTGYEPPRERAEKYGVGVLSNSELWAIILRTGMPQLPITTLTAKMMSGSNNSLIQLQRRERKELMELDGIGMVKAVQIEAVFEIAKRYFMEAPLESKKITSSKDIYHYMLGIANLPHEEIWVIYLKRSGHVICKRRITTGSAIASLYDIKAVMRHALLEKAECLILCHNHPSGNLRPSQPDRDITARTKEVCKAMDIHFMDHVIVTSHGYYSFMDNGDIRP